MEDKNLNKEILQETDVRIRKIQKEMANRGAEAMLVSSNANIFYVSGCVFRGYVYIPVQGAATYMVIRPVEFNRGKTIYIRKPEQIVGKLAETGVDMPERLALEFDSLTYTDFQRLSKCFTGKELVNASPLLREARIIKTPYEIARMREDGEHQVAVYRHIGKICKENMTDIELQVEIERSLRLEGALGFNRMSGQLMEINMGSVLAGDNADAPGPYDFAMGGAGVDPALPVGANGTVLRAGTTVMVDMNGNFNGYQTDMTRVWKVGDISPLAMKAHEVSLGILHKLEKVCVPGFPICEMVEIAEDMAVHAGLADYFMGHRQKAGFIGHGVGIELNEQPVIMSRNKNPLREYMTIALEPKFVIPGTGAVGAENTYVVTEKGLLNLTPFTEEIMNL